MRRSIPGKSAPRKSIRGVPERSAAQYKATLAAAPQGIRSRAVRAYCRCCRATPSPSTASIIAGGGKLDYTATAGTFSLFDQSGERSAAIFYTAYVAKPAGQANRPVTFVFNGGPGAASAFLHLGLVGPRLAQFGPDGRDAAKVRLIDNPDTWLAFTDLVLIDPVGTGWSRAAKSDGSEAFWGVRADAESMAKVVALYVAKNARVSSPKFLLGESYGGFRAAKVARALQDEQGISVNGILMLSPMLEGSFQFGGNRFALGAALQLPSLAAAEMERKGTFSKEALAQAEHFALTDYLSALAGPPLQGDAAKAFYARVAAMTGLARRRIGEAPRLHRRLVYQRPAPERPQDRQSLRRDVRGRRSESGIAGGARPRSDPRRAGAILRQRLRFLCAR